MKPTILFLAANPLGTDRLALDEECAAIERELRMTPGRDDFDFRSKWAVSVDELMRHLNELHPTILHFTGHGSTGATGTSPAHGGRHRDIALPRGVGIFLQEEQGSQYVSEHALAKMIASAAPSTRVLVLNACYSTSVAGSLCDMVDCVVGMDGAIGDAAARSFAVGFYRALGNRRSVGNAFDQAVATLAAKQLSDHLPVCRTRDGLSADQIFLPASGLDRLASALVTDRQGSSIRPLTPESATKVANSILGGDILRSQSHVDRSTGEIRVVAVRRTSIKDYDIRVYLMEQIGATYRILWSSEDLFGFSDSRVLDAEDIDGDGICEVIFSDHMYGTHQNSHSLHFYFPARDQLYSVREDSNPSWLPDPPAPSTGLHPEPPKELRAAIEAAAMARGFLKFIDDDLDRPDAAVRRWFRDNGHSPNCPISVHEYAGPPVWGSSITDELIVENVTWRSYFKGPVYRYNIDTNRHYVVYAPADRYNWAKALLWDGESLWFGVHLEDGLIRFHEPSTTLQRIQSIGGKALPNVEELSFDSRKGQLIINTQLSVRISDLPPLPRF